MSLIVLDASVWLKVLLPRQETGAEAALQIWERVMSGEDQLVQPPHWMAEVAAILCRLSPTTVDQDVRSLHAMELPVSDGPEVFETAVALALDLDHHLFDTLYHAVALTTDDATLVTADLRYARKAQGVGRLTAIA